VFGQILEFQAPLHKCKAPLLKTFWRQFWFMALTQGWCVSSVGKMQPHILSWCNDKEGKNLISLRTKTFQQTERKTSVYAIAKLAEK